MWRALRGWTDHRYVRLGEEIRRSAYFVSVPDIQLFPPRLNAGSVMFRAGMELWIMNAGLSLLAALRRRFPFPVTDLLIDVLQQLSNLLLPFGSDRGGMKVTVTGLVGGYPKRLTWQLVAEGGEGPFVPGIVVRTRLRRIEDIEPGARPCLGETPLANIEEALSGLSISTKKIETDCPTLFQSALADQWSILPSELRRLHSVQDMESFSGVAQITRGRSIIAGFIAWLAGFPPAGDNVPVTVTKTRINAAETWERNFAGRNFRFSCLPSPQIYHYRERIGPLTVELALEASGENVDLLVRRGWFLGIPIPAALLPRSRSREFVHDHKFHFDVALTAPLGIGLIVRYRGWLRPDADKAQMHHGRGVKKLSAATLAGRNQ